MRITAQEAREKASIKLNSESILDVIYKNIGNLSSKGYMVYTIHSDKILNDGFTNPMIDELFNNSKVEDEITNQLQEFGFKVLRYQYCITIKWNNETD